MDPSGLHPPLCQLKKFHEKRSSYFKRSNIYWIDTILLYLCYLTLIFKFYIEVDSHYQLTVRSPVFTTNLLIIPVDPSTITDVLPSKSRELLRWINVVTTHFSTSPPSCIVTARPYNCDFASNDEMTVSIVTVLPIWRWIQVTSEIIVLVLACSGIYCKTEWAEERIYIKLSDSLLSHSFPTRS
jgi:hypothetical protein